MSAGPECIPCQLEPAPEAVDPILAEAVNAAELLLAYAAEQGSDLDENLMQTIVRSKHTLTTRALPEGEESEFWIAYRKLCIATAPVSRESLEATNVQPVRSHFGTRDVSEVGRAVKLYRVVAISSIFVLLLFQVYWVFLSTLVNDSRRINSELIVFELDGFKAGLQQSATERENSEEDANLQNQASDAEVVEKLSYRSNPKYRDLLHQWNANLLLLKKTDVLSKAFKASIDQTAAGYGGYMVEFRRAVQIQTGTVTLNIMSLYILPILYGLVGACAYILRTISQQIKARTFTRASKVRLQLRMVLGRPCWLFDRLVCGGRGSGNHRRECNPLGSRVSSRL